MSFILKLGWFFRKRWLYYVFTVVLMSSTSFLNSVAPRLVGDAIDKMKGGLLTEALLMQTVGLLFGIAILMYLFFLCVEQSVVRQRGSA